MGGDGEELRHHYVIIDSLFFYVFSIVSQYVFSSFFLGQDRKLMQTVQLWMDRYDLNHDNGETAFSTPLLFLGGP